MWYFIFLQENHILIMHESEMICRLFRIGDSVGKNKENADQHIDDNDNSSVPTSSGLRLGNSFA